MSNFWAWIGNNLGWRDLADVLVVAVIAYNFLMLIRGTRAVQILWGVIVLLAFQGVFYLFKLQAAYFVVRGLVLSIVVALPIVFQPELRRALMQLGARSIVSPFAHVSRDVLVKTIDEIAWGASILSQTRTGALIVIERETGLEEFIERGVQVNGEVSSKLLLSIFNPRSPLHDGAAIIRGDKVVAASVYLPLFEAPMAFRERSFGTRHRAAMGVSEETDAVVVVVSEETGSISIAKDGKLTPHIDEETLKRSLLMFLAPPPRPPSQPGQELLEAVRGWFRREPVRMAASAPPLLAVEPAAEGDSATRELSASDVETAHLGEAVREGVREPTPEEEAAEAQRLNEEAVQRRAEEAQRRKAEEEALKAEEGARKAEEEARKSEGPDESSEKPPVELPPRELAGDAGPASAPTAPGRTGQSAR